MAELRDRIDRSTPDTAAPQEIPTPRSWAATATATDWDALYEWVDWMVDTYGVSARMLPACWPAHPGLVEELAGLREGWVHARLACVVKPSDQMSYWHDRCLYPLLDRIKSGTLYGLNDCAQGTHKPVKRDPRRTDRRARPASPVNDDG